jgi:predicted RNase H-like HicB family nuclease
MNLAIEFEQEDDGRWIAEIPSLPGVMAYGTTKPHAESKVEALALRAIADRIERENCWNAFAVACFSPSSSSGAKDPRICS